MRIGFLVSCIVLVFFVAFPGLASAGEFKVFGPETFVRQKHAPAKIRKSFSVANPNTKFFLRVYEGGHKHFRKVSLKNVIISVNGVKVLKPKKPKHCKHGLNLLGIPVTLKSNNIIEVEMRGKPCSSIIVCIVGIDNVGPIISNLSPPNSSETKEARPLVSASYTDELSGIDMNSLCVTLDGQDITSKANITKTSFSYTPNRDLSLASHSVNINVSDAAGNTSAVSSVFTVISSGPPITEESGFIHGYVFNSRTQQPLKDVSIAVKGVEGNVLTDESGKFVFPTPTGGVYELTAAKGGFTYGQRKVEIAQTRDVAVDTVYLVPQDTKATIITTQGGTAVNSTGTVELVFPEGAVPESAGEINVLATQYEEGKELPGPLPDTSFFTYAVDFEPDGTVFDKPVTFRLKNTRGFASGTRVPIGYYNKNTLEWEKVGMGVVDGTGEWAIFEITHFSPYDCNFPAIPPVNALNPVGAYILAKSGIGTAGNIANEIPGKTDSQDPDNKPGDPAGWSVDYEEGNLLMEYELPSVRSLNKANGLNFIYRSEHVKPKYLVKTKTYLDLAGGPAIAPTLLPETSGYKISIEGKEKSVKFTPEAGHAVQRYLWDGKNAREESLKTGSYPYRVTLSNDYKVNYATANYFAGPPIADTGIPSGEVKGLETIIDGRATIINQTDSPFGSGWSLKELQRLYFDPDGTILLTEGDGRSAVFNSDPLGYTATVEGKMLVLSSHYKEVIDEIKTPKNSNSVLASPDGVKAYSFYSFDNLAYMTIIDIPSTTVEETITLYSVPKNSYTRIKGQAISKDGSRIYIAYSPMYGDAGFIAVIDTQTKQVVDTISVSYALGQILLSPDNLCIYAGAYSSGQGKVLKINLSTKETEAWSYSKSDGRLPYSMALNKNESTLYVQHAYGGSTPSGYISVMDTVSGSETKIIEEYGRGEADIILSKDDKYLYASYAFGSFIDVIDISDFSKFYRYNSVCGQLVFESAGRYLYASSYNYVIAVIDTEKKEIIRKEYCATWPRLSSFSAPDQQIKLYTSDKGETSKLVKNQDGSFVRMMKDKSKIFFDSEGRQTRSVDINGNTTAHVYDVNGRLVSIEDPAGKITRFNYSASGYLDSVVDPGGRTTRFYVDGSGDLTQIDSPDNTTDIFSYISGHLMSSHQDRRGFVTSFEYDGSACVNKVISPAKEVLEEGELYTKNEIREFTPSITTCLVNNLPEDASAAVIHPDDIKEYFADGKNNVTTFSGVSQEQFIEPGSDRISQIDALGNITAITKDRAYKPFSIVNPKGTTSSFSYDVKGNLLTHTQKNIGATTTFAYDNEFKHLSMVKDPKNQSTLFSYDTRGNLTQIQDASGKLTKLDYDTRGLLVKTTGALNNQATFTYDATSGNLLSITDSLGNVTAFGYDSIGNVISCTDAAGNSTHYEYDIMSRLVSMRDADNNTTTYSYDASGNLIRIQDAGGNVTEFSYDSVGQLTEMRNPIGKIRRYYYDSNRNLARMITEKGEAINFVYDATNRLIRKELPDNIVYYAYDNAGNLVSAANKDSNIELGYDLADRLVRVLTHAPQPERAISYEYDLNSNRTKLIYPDLTYVTYEYDQLDRVAKIKNQASQIIASYSYDALSRRTGKSLLNGNSTSYVYDAISRLKTLTNTRSPQSKTYTYAYDSVGNRLSRQDSSGTENYTYDNIYRLTGVSYPNLTNAAYNYDSLGNRTSITEALTTSYTSNALNQYVAVGEAAYSYDDNGNLISDGTNTYGYDSENRLVSATTPSHTAAYAYDASGRRISKTVDGVITAFLYDGDDIMAECDSLGNLIAKYVHGADIDEPVNMEKGGQSYYYHYDGLGSVTDLTSSTGVISESYSYDAFGKPSVVSAIGNRYMFTGREYDAETGLYYYRERSYSPQIGRFLQTDPVGAYDENRYTYCYNNPVNLVDPYGLVAVGVSISQPVSLPQINDLRGTKKIDGSYDTTSFSKKAKENAEGKEGKNEKSVENKNPNKEIKKNPDGSTTEIKWRRRPGEDGARSRIRKEIDPSGNTKEVRHEVVDKNGNIIHTNLE